MLGCLGLPVLGIPHSATERVCMGREAVVLAQYLVVLGIAGTTAKGGVHQSSGCKHSLVFSVCHHSL
jgi:hypothetical protein